MDIETAPSLGWVWSKYETNVIEFKKDWFILSFAYKWLGEKAIHVKGLDDYASYKRDKESDKHLVQALWKVVDEADIIIGHNLNKFDIRKSNARFIEHGLRPPSPYKTVDTLSIARRIFRFDSNHLDDLGGYLGVGRKLPHTGFALWRGCMQGDPKAWVLMKRYNVQDVALLERVYLKLRSWDTTHPPVSPGQPDACPKCGSRNIVKQGYAYTAYRKRQRFQCMKCKGWFQGGAKGLS